MEANYLSNQPIVIDNGSGSIKTGFAGGNSPRVSFRSCVGRIKHTRAIPGGALQGSDTFIGSKVEEHRGALFLSHPIEHGIVQDWNEMEKLWSYLYGKENLNVNSEEHAVLLTEAALNPYQNRQRSMELFFEKFNIPAMYVALQAILSLFASGRTTGVVLDCGEGVSHCVPVYEGLAVQSGINRMDIAGSDVTHQLKLLLRRSGHTFVTSAETEIVREIKERCCRVSANITSDELLFTEKRASSKGSIRVSNPSQFTQYQLPDGSVIELGPETFRAPEILFQPQLVGSEYRGLPDVLVTSIMRCDIDLRKTMFSQIVLAGGSTLFAGFGERLLSEIRNHSLPPKETKVRIAAPPERINTAWIGGSILAALSTFKTMWITKQEYHEQGNRLLGAL